MTMTDDDRRSEFEAEAEGVRSIFAFFDSLLNR